MNMVNPDNLIPLVNGLTKQARRTLALTASAKELRFPTTFRDIDVDGDGRINKDNAIQWFIIRGDVEKWLEAADRKRRREHERKEMLDAMNVAGVNPIEPKPKTQTTVRPPSFQQLRYVFYRGFLPMLGFGFLNNSVMLIFGGLIDQSLGATLGFSTLAAAGFGNVISDLTGYSFGRALAAAASKLGLPDPDLTRDQSTLGTVKMAQWLGGAAGLLTGGIFGLTPLLLFNNINIGK